MKSVRNWEQLVMKYKLDEVCTKITDGSHYSPKACNIGYPMLSVKDMLEYGFDYSKCKHISEDDYKKMLNSGCVPQKDDILVAKDGSYLKQIFIYKEEKEEAILSSIAIFRPNTSIIIPKYLCYLLKSPQVFNYIANNCVSGSALPRIVLKAFKTVNIEIPDLLTQQCIATILSVLDDKIELNNKINENLEQQAQAIFKSWFVDFEPFGGVMPDDWKIGKVIDIPMTITDYVANGSFTSLKANVTLKKEKSFAYFIRNTDLKSNSFNTYVDKRSYEFLSKSALHGGEIIISNVGDVGSVFLCPKLDMPMTLGNNVIMLRPNNEIYQYYLYIWFKWMQGQTYIQKIKGGSAQPKFNKTDFKNTPVLIPSSSILKEFCNISKSIFEKITDNNAENNQLSTIRDTLLPKLMNGEIDVSEVEI